jgi:hypothetical protein
VHGFTGIGPLIWQRLLASWRLLAVLAFGILIAATLMAASPVYTRVMNDLGLETSLGEQIGSASRNGLVRFDLPLGSAQSAREAQGLSALVSDSLDWLTGSYVSYGSVGALTLAREGQPVPTDRFRTLIALHSASDLESHVRVTEGSVARPTSDPRQLEVVMPMLAARYLGLKPGDRIVAAFSVDDCNRPPPTEDPEELAARARFRCVPQAFITFSAPVTVTGLVEQTDANDPYWVGAPVLFSEPYVTDTQGAVVPVVLPQESFYQALPLLLTGVPSQFRFTSFADISRLNSANIDRTRETLAALRARIEESGAIPDLAMAGPLESFKTRADFNQVPLLILLLQVVGIAVYYVLLVSSLLAERRAEETAVLRSRGATVGQVVALAAGEAAVLAVAAALVAPFLASAIVAGLGKTGTFEEVSGGDLLPFTLVPASFGFALGGAAIAAVAVILPAFFAARQGMVLFLRSSARPGKPFLQRYYLDFGLVGLAALGLYQLNQQGSVFDPRSVGGWSADPLLLLSPLILIVAIGALMFRFLPLLLSLVGRIVTATAGPGVTLGFWQLTRSPARYTQLALLVVMAASVGTFAATYSETSDRSQEERALYQNGSDVRLTGLGTLAQSPSRQAMVEKLTAVPGVEQAAMAMRTSLTLGPLPGFGDRVDVLGIDPERAPDLLWFREDFADESLITLTRSIAGSASGGGGLLLPGQPAGITLWAAPTVARDNSTLWARTVDANGVFRLHELGLLDFEGSYRRLTAMFNPNDGMRYPASLIALIVTQPASNNDSTRSNLLVDDVAAIDASGQETIVEDFEAGFRWDVLRTATRNRDTVQRVSQGALRGSGAALFGFRTGTASPVRGMYVSDPNLPAPALASRRFLDRTGLRAGSEVELVMGSVLLPLSIQGEVSLFPTLADPETGFLVVNQDHVYFFAGLTLQTNATAPNEAWLTVAADPEARATALAGLREDYGIQPSLTLDVVDRLQQLGADPIVKAGGSGILLLALLAAFSILALGFALTLYLGGQARTVEVSVMRAVGLSSRQIFVMISLEYLLIAAIGLVIGTIAGLRISDLMLSFLNVTEQGARVVPPFALSTRWDTVGVAFAAVAIAFLVGVMALAGYFLRVPVSRVLRLTR